MTISVQSIDCLPITCLALCLALWRTPKHVHASGHVQPLWLFWTRPSSCIMQVLPIFSDLLLTELFWPHPPLESIFSLGIHDNSQGPFAFLAHLPFLAPWNAGFPWCFTISPLMSAISYPLGASTITHTLVGPNSASVAQISLHILHSDLLCPPDIST